MTGNLHFCTAVVSFSADNDDKPFAMLQLMLLASRMLSSSNLDLTKREHQKVQQNLLFDVCAASKQIQLQTLVVVPAMQTKFRTHITWKAEYRIPRRPTWSRVSNTAAIPRVLMYNCCTDSEGYRWRLQHIYRHGKQVYSQCSTPTPADCSTAHDGGS